MSFLDRMLERIPSREPKYYCPICGKGYREFLPAGTPLRRHVVCPVCHSLERHRLLWVVLKAHWEAGHLAQGGRLLHVAPERCLQERLQHMFEYTSVDLSSPLAQVLVDITQLPFASNAFDAVVCNHVLEHVPNDFMALKELFRVLKDGAWASIQVPISGELTLEDPAIVDGLTRSRLYGQADHVRQYGADFLKRLMGAGFSVRIVHKRELGDKLVLDRLSVSCEENVWICNKLPLSASSQESQ